MRLPWELGWLATAEAARFASMCIASKGHAATTAALARRCAMQVCSLMLTTRSGRSSWSPASATAKSRSCKEQAAAAPARLYTYHKLHMWDLRFAGEARIAFVDSDALFVRNATALLSVEEVPAAWFMRNACKPPNVSWAVWDAGIWIDGARVPKAQAYWDSGVVVFDPDAKVHAELWRLYRSGDFASLDPGAYLGPEWNFRGYKCSYADVRLKTSVSILNNILDAGECLDPRASYRLRATCLT
ncbi:hypothetical protein M885DRAFT_562265 [Pelagophyceae sp. CCMP2097]|nr:hypothetical protein M885DRAFT_562265 [Pelagophyceae sp. CCMP2097]